MKTTNTKMPKHFQLTLQRAFGLLIAFVYHHQNGATTFVHAVAYHSYPSGDVYQGPAHTNDLQSVEVVVRHNPYADSPTVAFSTVFDSTKATILHFATTYCPVADENVKKLKTLADANADVQFFTIIPYNNQDGNCFKQEALTDSMTGASMTCQGDGGAALYYVKGFSYLWSANLNQPETPKNYKLLQDTPYLSFSGMNMYLKGEFYSKFGVSTANGESWHTKEQVVAFTKNGNNFGMMFPQRRSGSQGIVGMQWDAYDSANGGPKTSGVMWEDVQALLTAVKADNSPASQTPTPTPAPTPASSSSDSRGTPSPTPSSPSPSPTPSPAPAPAPTTPAPDNHVFYGQTKLTFTTSETCTTGYLTSTLGPSVVKGLASFLSLAEDRVALDSVACARRRELLMVDESGRTVENLFAHETADAKEEDARRLTSSTVSGDFGYRVSGFSSQSSALTSLIALQNVDGSAGSDTALVSAVNTALPCQTVNTALVLSRQTRTKSLGGAPGRIFGSMAQSIRKAMPTKTTVTLTKCNGAASASTTCGAQTGATTGTTRSTNEDEERDEFYSPVSPTSPQEPNHFGREASGSSSGCVVYHTTQLYQELTAQHHQLPFRPPTPQNAPELLDNFSPPETQSGAGTAGRQMEPQQPPTQLQTPRGSAVNAARSRSRAGSKASCSSEHWPLHCSQLQQVLAAVGAGGARPVTGCDYHNHGPQVEAAGNHGCHPHIVDHDLQMEEEEERQRKEEPAPLKTHVYCADGTGLVLDTPMLDCCGAGAMPIQWHSATRVEP
ncbi:unnamed protein product [Amoebophrya sp. A120]|nr:unnamed protein product [Amoebophrya sp. A120]|eukprot:GSA120T00007737001.1